LAYFDTFHNLSYLSTKTSGGETDTVSSSGDTVASCGRRETDNGPTFGVASDAGAAAPVQLPAVSPSEPAFPPAIPNDPPKPPEPQPSLESQQPVVTTNQTPLEDTTVDRRARELITRGWAMYNLPYTPVRWREARGDFDRALELDSRSIEARIGLASILSTKLADGWSPVLQEDIPRAEHLLLEALDTGGVSNRAAAHFTLGLLRQMQTRLPEAEGEFETAISLDPNNARAYLHLGETLLYLGQPEAGIPPLEHAIRLGPGDPNIAINYWTLGTCQLLSGRVGQAIDLLQTARAANTRLWVPYFYLAGSYGLQGDLDKARSALGVEDAAALPRFVGVKEIHILSTKSGRRCLSISSKGAYLNAS
jgi:hypothetical protein